MHIRYIIYRFIIYRIWYTFTCEDFSSAWHNKVILILSGIIFEIQSLNHEKKAGKFSVLFLHCLLNVTNNQNQRQTCPSNSGSNELGLGRLCPLMHQQTVLRFASWFCCLQNLNQNPSRVLVFKKLGNKSPWQCRSNIVAVTESPRLSLEIVASFRKLR